MTQPRIVVIEGMAVTSLARAWLALAGGLDLPGHFGRNLDALHDSLTGDVPGPLAIEWRDWPASAAALGADAKALRAVLEEASDARGDLTVRFLS